VRALDDVMRRDRREGEVTKIFRIEVFAFWGRANF